MNKIISTLLFSTFALFCSATEYGSFVSARNDSWDFEPVILGIGDRLVIDNASADGNDINFSVYFRITTNNGMTFGAKFDEVQSNSENAEARTIVGPCTVVPYSPDPTTDWCYIAYRIDRAADDSIQQPIITQLPLDIDGNAEVLVETCDDLTLGDWTMVHSSTFTSDGVNKQYYRTRVIQK